MRRAAVAVLSLVSVLYPIGSRAADSSPSPPLGADQIQFAAHEHDLGYRAYLGKMYDDAATHFENAFFAAPNPAELRYAIRARRDAAEQARAATLAAIGQRKFPADASTSKLADEVIAEARAVVGEIRIVSETDCSVAVDERIVAIEKVRTFRFFVMPGKHELRISWSDERTKTVPIEAKAGGSQTLEVEPPAPPAPPPTAEPPLLPAPPVAILPIQPPAPPEAPPKAAPSKPLGPAVFVAGAALTAVGVGLTVWSGIDAENNPGQGAVKLECVGLGEGCPEYQKGLAAQRRTNIFLAGTGGVAAVTAIVGVFFTQWSDRDRAAPRAGRAGRGIEVEPALGVGEAGLLGTF